MPSTMYERLGGMEFFEALTQEFYQRVATDELLRPLYPDDLGEPRRHLCLFLAQFFGGPRIYEDERGSPALRARHAPFPIGQAERDHWVAHMTAAVDVCRPGPLEREQLLGYFASAATHLVNSVDSA